MARAVGCRVSDMERDGIEIEGTMDASRNLRGLCAIERCPGPMTSKAFVLRIVYDKDGNELAEPHDIEIHACEHHETWLLR